MIVYVFVRGPVILAPPTPTPGPKHNVPLKRSLVGGADNQEEVEGKNRNHLRAVVASGENRADPAIWSVLRGHYPCGVVRMRLFMWLSVLIPVVFVW
jgi:hypothetical protein